MRVEEGEDSFWGEINAALTREVLVEEERSEWIREIAEMHNSQASLGG